MINDNDFKRLQGIINEKESIIREKDKQIEVLTKELDKYKKYASFLSKGFDLPDDYYENDKYLSD